MDTQDTIQAKSLPIGDDGVQYYEIDHIKTVNDINGNSVQILDFTETTTLDSLQKQLDALNSNVSDVTNKITAINNLGGEANATQ